MILAAYLTERGESLTAFCARTDRKVQTVHAWLSGNRTPSIAEAVAIEEQTEGKVTVRDWLQPQALIRDAKAAVRAAADQPPAG